MAQTSSQSIHFDTVPDSIAMGGVGVVAATATSALEVNYSSATPTICAVSSKVVSGVKMGVVSGIKKGDCTIAANQAGNATYFQAPAVTKAITILKGGIVTSVPCNTTSYVDMANTCTPDIILYIAGSSSLTRAVIDVVAGSFPPVGLPDDPVPSYLFDTSLMPIIKIVDNGSPNAGAVSAWLGMSSNYVTSASQLLFVVFNSKNGSGSGVSQMLAKLEGKITEADVVSIGPTKTAAGICTIDVAASTDTAPVIDCTNHALTQVDMTISDVAPQELYKLYSSATHNLSSLIPTSVLLQGFGIGVNANLYAAMQTQNIAEHLLPSSCVAGDASAACQPSIRRSDYASLVTKQGSIKSAAMLLGDSGDTTVLTLVRHSDTSGEQAASNIFFADNACGTNVTAKGKEIKDALGGALDIVGAAQTTASLVVLEKSTSVDVVTALNSPSGYAIGVLSLTTVPGARDHWNFIKIDGQSSTFNTDGTYDHKQRNAFLNGSYPFAMTAFAITPLKGPKNPDKLSLTDAVTAGLQDWTHNPIGIGYFGWVNGGDMGSQVVRTDDNNCSPLIK